MVHLGKISTINKHEPIDFKNYFAIFRMILLQPVIGTLVLQYIFYKKFKLNRDKVEISAVCTFFILWIFCMLGFLYLNLLFYL